MDLTPKPSTPWWSIFKCCRSPSSLSTGEDETNSRNDDAAMIAATVSSNNHKVVTGGKRKIVSGEGIFLDSTATSCTDCSADVFFDSQDDHFIGDMTVYEKAGNLRFSNKALSSERLTKEEDDDSDGDSMCGVDVAQCWSAESSSLNKNQSANKEFYTNEIQNYNALDNEQRKINIVPEIKFYQFMALMMLRHIFGSWLLGWDRTNKIFNTRLMLTQCSSSEQGGYQKLMKQKN